jgi:serine/threonine protein kinase
MWTPANSSQPAAAGLLPEGVPPPAEPELEPEPEPESEEPGGAEISLAAVFGSERAVVRPSWVIPVADVEVAMGAEGFIGKGALAEVRKGILRGNPVALKGLYMLRADAASIRANETGRWSWIPPWERQAVLGGFMKECEMLRRCTHNNIVSFVGVVGDKEPLYLAMEYFPSGTLSDLIYGGRYAGLRTEGGKLPLRTQLIANSGLFKALEFLTMVPLIHRDIKPANVLVQVQGGILLKVLVADFGDAVPSPTTTVRGAAGTPTYLAPEMRAEDQAKCPKADVFSAGVVAVEMSSGVAPNPGPEMLKDGPAVCQLHIGGRARRILMPELERRADDLAAVHHPFIAELALRCIVDAAANRAAASEISMLIDIAIDGAMVPAEVAQPCAA